MFCNFRNCAVRGESDRLVICWLCDSFFHVKCAALNARIFDALSESKGLRWSCEDCRSTDVDILKLIRQSRRGFLEVSKDLEAAQVRLAEFESLFKTFKVLDETNVSPKRKRNTKNLRSSAKSASKTTLESTKGVQQLSSELPSPNLNLPLEMQSIDIEKIQQTTDYIAPAKVAASADQMSPCVGASAVVPTVNVSADSPRTFGLQKTYAEACIETNCVSSPSITNFISTGAIPKQASNSSIEHSVHKDLVVIQPPKSIFVSRFAADTSEEDLLYFIKSKLNVVNINISVSKFRFAYERITSSFKITLPGDLYNKVIDQRFWPENTMVHEFISRSQPKTLLATLPIHSKDQKN